MFHTHLVVISTLALIITIGKKHFFGDLSAFQNVSPRSDENHESLDIKYIMRAKKTLCRDQKERINLTEFTQNWIFTFFDFNHTLIMSL